MKTFKVSCRIALFFFVVGTLLFLLQHATKNMDWLLIIGFYYVLFSVFINVIIVLTLLAKLFMDAEKLQTLKSIGIILLNAPIAYLYIQLIFT